MLWIWCVNWIYSTYLNSPLTSTGKLHHIRPFSSPRRHVGEAYYQPPIPGRTSWPLPWPANSKSYIIYPKASMIIRPVRNERELKSVHHISLHAWLAANPPLQLNDAFLSADKKFGWFLSAWLITLSAHGCQNLTATNLSLAKSPDC